MERKVCSFIFAIVLALVLLTVWANVSRAEQKGYDGHLPPTMMLEWERTHEKVELPYVEIRFGNPNGAIKYADALFILQPEMPGQMLLVAYTYEFNGEVYIIENDGNGFYKQLLPKKQDI